MKKVSIPLREDILSNQIDTTYEGECERKHSFNSPKGRYLI